MIVGNESLYLGIEIVIDAGYLQLVNVARQVWFVVIFYLERYELITDTVVSDIREVEFFYSKF